MNSNNSTTVLLLLKFTPCHTRKHDCFNSDKYRHIIETINARPLAYYVDDFYAGKPCLTVNEVNEGTVYYMGCDLDFAAMKNTYQNLLSDVVIDGTMEMNPYDVAILQKNLL